MITGWLQDLQLAENAWLPCGYAGKRNSINPLPENHVTGKKPCEQKCHGNLEMEKIWFSTVPVRKKTTWLGKCFQSWRQFFFSGKRTNLIDVTKILILPLPCPGYQDMLLSQVNKHNDKDNGYHGDSHGNHHWRHNWTGTSSCRTAWFGRVFIIGTGNNGAELGNN